MFSELFEQKAGEKKKEKASGEEKTGKEKEVEGMKRILGNSFIRFFALLLIIVIMFIY